FVIDDHHRLTAPARQLAHRLDGGFSDVGRDRQPDLKAGALSHCGFDVDCTAEIGHDAVHQRQDQPRTFADPSRGEEWIEYAFDHVGWNTDTRIFDHQANVRARGENAARHRL